MACSKIVGPFFGPNLLDGWFEWDFPNGTERE